MSLIISGFPGVGKSTLFGKYGADRVSDSDSSKFPKDKFPTNYLNHIKMLQGKREFILVSSHQAVRRGLVECELPFTLVYPNVGLKEEYLQRYTLRGSPESFVSMMNDKWDMFIAECKAQTGCEHIELQANQFLIDVI